MRILALDIGGTSVKYGIFENKETTFGQFSVKQSDGSENIPMSLCSFALEHKPDVVAVSTPGPFDFETGKSHMVHKLPSMYHVSLKEKLKMVLPDAITFFVHDSTAFAIGALKENPKLSNKSFAAVMLGTGLGYTVVEKGKVLLNKKQTPLHSLWNRSFLDGISEDYVSTKVLLAKSQKCGIKAENVKMISDMAQKGNKKLVEIFYTYGKHLGMCIQNARYADSFSNLVIGGQISKSWSLMKDGFESECNIEYNIINDPATCALIGLYECAIHGKEKYYIISE